jgi:hypothetical protein
MNNNLKAWLIGALNALISGAAGAAAGFVVGDNFRQAMEIALISAFVSLSKWMIQHPLPGSPPSPPVK